MTFTAEKEKLIKLHTNWEKLAEEYRSLQKTCEPEKQSYYSGIINALELCMEDIENVVFIEQLKNLSSQENTSGSL